MFSFLKTNKPALKGFKVALNSDRSKKYGIAVSSLEMLQDKIRIKFKLKEFDLFLHDGSLIDDNEYFLSIPPQSLIVVALKGEEIKTGKDFIESFLEMSVT
jgi:CIDE-N domain